MVMFCFTEIPELLGSFRRRLLRTHREIPRRCGNSYHELQHSLPDQQYPEYQFVLPRRLTPPVNSKRIEHA